MQLKTWFRRVVTLFRTRLLVTSTGFYFSLTLKNLARNGGEYVFTSFSDLPRNHLRAKFLRVGRGSVLLMMLMSAAAPPLCGRRPRCRLFDWSVNPSSHLDHPFHECSMLSSMRHRTATSGHHNYLLQSQYPFASIFFPHEGHMPLARSSCIHFGISNLLFDFTLPKQGG